MILDGQGNCRITLWKCKVQKVHMVPMETTFQKIFFLKYIDAMILAKFVLLTISSLSLDLSHRLSQPWGGAMCYWNII